MALITTAGSSTADSYVTDAEATTYIDHMPFTTKYEWAELSLEEREARLKTAALFLNTVAYRGAKACLEQRLDFPRWFRTDDGYPSYEDTYETMSDITDAGYTAPTVPQEVKDAQCEIAFQVMHSIIYKANPGASAEVDPSSFTMGSLSLSFQQAVGASVFNKANLASTSIIHILLGKWERHIGGGVI